MKHNTHELTARINKFLDRKFAKSLDASEIDGHKVKRSHRQLTEVSDSPYIALAIR